MPSRYAVAIEVPELRQKLWLLYQLNGGIEDDSSLGRLFRSDVNPQGVSGKAVRLWVYGDGSREKNKIPAEKFERFVEIYQDRLPGGRTFSETRALLMSPNVGELADAFHGTGPAANWINFTLGAKPGGIEMVSCGRRHVLGITSRGRTFEDFGGFIEFPVDHWFRFNVPAEKGWLTLLQHGKSGWYGLEVSEDSVTFEWSDGEALLPTSSPFFIEDEPGSRRFLFLTTLTPLPPDLNSRLDTSAKAPAPLDAATLDRLARFIDESGTAKMSALDVLFVVDDDRI